MFQTFKITIIERYKIETVLLNFFSQSQLIIFLTKIGYEKKSRLRLNVKYNWSNGLLQLIIELI